MTALFRTSRVAVTVILGYFGAFLIDFSPFWVVLAYFIAIFVISGLIWLVLALFEDICPQTGTKHLKGHHER